MKVIENKINVLTYRLNHDEGKLKGEERIELMKQLHEYEIQKIRLEYEQRFSQQQSFYETTIQQLEKQVEELKKENRQLEQVVLSESCGSGRRNDDTIEILMRKELTLKSTKRWNRTDQCGVLTCSTTQKGDVITVTITNIGQSVRIIGLPACEHKEIEKNINNRYIKFVYVRNGMATLTFSKNDVKNFDGNEQNENPIVAHLCGYGHCLQNIVFKEIKQSDIQIKE